MLVILLKVRNEELGVRSEELGVRLFSCSQVLPGNTVHEALPHLRLEAEQDGNSFPAGDWEPVVSYNS